MPVTRGEVVEHGAHVGIGEVLVNDLGQGRAVAQRRLQVSGGELSAGVELSPGHVGAGRVELLVELGLDDLVAGVEVLVGELEGLGLVPGLHARERREALEAVSPGEAMDVAALAEGMGRRGMRFA